MKQPAILILLFAALATQGIAAHETAEQHLDRGASQLYQGNYTEAALEFEQALKLAPGYLKARVNLATAYYRLGRLQDAERELVTCLGKDPSYLNARFNLAIVYEAEGKLDEALAGYRLAAASDRLRSGALRQVGRILDSRGDLEEAKAAYEQALRADPNQAEAASVRNRLESIELELVKKRIEAGGAPTRPGPTGEERDEQPRAATAEPASAAFPAAPTGSRATGPAPSTGSDAKVKSPDHPTEPASASGGTPPQQTASPPATAPFAAPSTEATAASGAAKRSDLSHAKSASAEAAARKPADPEALAALLKQDITEREADATIFVSMPLGARVYLQKEDIRVRDPFVKYGPFLADKKRRDYLALVPDLVKKENDRGRTPLVLHLEPGNYQVAFKLEGKEENYRRDGNTYFRTPALLPDQELLRSDTKVYELRIAQGRAPAWLTALFIPQEGFSPPLPPGGGFPLSVDRLKADLAPFHPDEAAVDAAIAELRGFGKALLDTESAQLLITLDPEGRPEVTRLHR